MATRCPWSRVHSREPCHIMGDGNGAVFRIYGTDRVPGRTRLYDDGDTRHNHSVSCRLYNLRLNKVQLPMFKAFVTLHCEVLENT